MAKLRFTGLLVCQLPKHKGELWIDIIEEDREYVEWLVSGEGPSISDTQYDYLMELLEEN